MTVVLLLLNQSISIYAQELVPTREERRKLIPIDKLIKHLEKPKRDQSLQLDMVMNILGVKKGDVVADVGAGTGVFSFRLASKVGMEGKVFAVEIEDGLIDYIRNKVEKNGVTNIIPVKSSESGPNLSPACCDKIVLVNTYNYFPDPIAFMINLRKALKPGGLVAIIDMDQSKDKALKKLSVVSDVINDMKSSGFELRGSHDYVDGKYFLVFGAIE